MERDEQIDRFEEDVQKVIHRFRHEFDIPYASLIGVLHILAYELSKEAFDVAEEDES